MGNRGSTTDNNEQEIGLDHVITRLYKISSRLKKKAIRIKININNRNVKQEYINKKGMKKEDSSI